MSEHQPPKLPLKLFRYFCSPERLEELEGDLFEVYHYFVEEKGATFSKLFYWWIVLRSFRSYALKRTKTKNLGLMTTLITHLRHNLIIGWRNLLKNRATASINILGLAIGIGAFIAIFSIVQYELSFNADVKDADRVYRIRSSFSGSFTATNRGVPIPTGRYVEETFTGFESVAYFHTYVAKVKVPEDDNLRDLERQEGIILTKAAYFDLIDDYEWLAGDPSSALEDPYKLVLTSDQAIKYFGNISWDQMINREVIYRDSLNVFVTGIVKKPDYNTDFIFTDFISHSTIEASWLKERYSDDEWDSTTSSTQLWIKAYEDTSLESITSQIKQLNEHAADLLKSEDYIHHFELQPLDDVHFNPEIGIFNNGTSPAHAKTLTILGVVAFAILLIAVFNFVNLETAQSTSKSKEVGVRKVLGSPKGMLVNRFLTESTLISLIAIFLALPIAHYGFEYFQEFLPQGIALEYANPMFWLSLLAIAILVGLFSGFYPSWVISSFQPIKALRPSATSTHSGGTFLRKSLILIQFIFSQLLIVGTLAITWQISFMLDKDLGFNDEGIIYFYTPYYEAIEKQKLITDYIEKLPEVESFSKQNYLPAQNGYSTSTVKYNTPEGEVITSVHVKSGDTTFMNFFGIDLLAGRNVLPNDSLKELLINERFMRDLGYENPRDVIGKKFEFWDEQQSIAGVVKDYHFRSLHHDIEPLVFTYDEDNRCIALKVNAGNVESVINKLTDKWDEIYLQNPLTVNFMDETIERFYETERRASKLASTATGIAILISCLGLFGLISFTIVQKSKEVGIRKVLGASLFNIGSILSREFIILIVLAFIISTPISYYFISQMMEEFAYQTNIQWWIYILGGMVSLLIAMVSIATKIWKASSVNPIESLKYE